MISSIQFKGKQNSSVHQILTNAIPERRLKLFIMLHLRLISKHVRSHTKLDINRILCQSFDGSYTFSKISLKQGKNLSCVHHFLSTWKLETVSEYQNKHSLHFASYLADNVVTNITSKPSHYESLAATPIINFVDSRTALGELNVLEGDFSAVLASETIAAAQAITNEIKYGGVRSHGHIQVTQTLQLIELINMSNSWFFT